MPNEIAMVSLALAHEGVIKHRGRAPDYPVEPRQFGEIDLAGDFLKIPKAPVPDDLLREADEGRLKAATLLVFGIQLASKAKEGFGVFLALGITALFFWPVNGRSPCYRLLSP